MHCDGFLNILLRWPNLGDTGGSPTAGLLPLSLAPPTPLLPEDPSGEAQAAMVAAGPSPSHGGRISALAATAVRSSVVIHRRGVAGPGDKRIKESMVDAWPPHDGGTPAAAPATFKPA
jgi:hypothetical protein